MTPADSGTRCEVSEVIPSRTDPVLLARVWVFVVGCLIALSIQIAGGGSLKEQSKSLNYYYYTVNGEHRQPWFLALHVTPLAKTSTFPSSRVWGLVGVLASVSLRWHLIWNLDGLQSETCGWDSAGSVMITGAVRMTDLTNVSSPNQVLLWLQ